MKRKSKLHIDGTYVDGTYQGDGRDPPFVVFDEDAQENVAGPFKTRADAVAARERIWKERGES